MISSFSWSLPAVFRSARACRLPLTGGGTPEKDSSLFGKSPAAGRGGHPTLTGTALVPRIATIGSFKEHQHGLIVRRQRTIADEDSCGRVSPAGSERRGLKRGRRFGQERLAGKRAVRIIAMTGNSAEDYGEACASAGMDGFIMKPVRLHQFREILAQSTADRRWRAPHGELP